MNAVEEFLESLPVRTRNFYARASREIARLMGERKVQLSWAILWKGEVVPTDMMLCSIWMITHADDCIVGKTKVGDSEVSTCFCTTPFSGTGQEPRHFETMVFNDNGTTRHFETMVFEGTGPARHYKTLEEAKAGHAAVVAQLEQGK